MPETLVRKFPRGRMRRFLFKYARVVARSRFCFPLVVRYVAWRIFPINKHANPEISVLLLDYLRWWREDLEALGSRAQLYVLPDELRAYILGLFFSGEQMKKLRTYRFDGDDHKVKEALIQYLIRLIPAVAKRKRFRCVITTNHMYHQNKPIAEACSKTSIPFIDIHKECNKDAWTAKLFRKKMEKTGCNLNFLGSKICVYNQLMKDLFVEMGVVSPEKIEVTGAMRMDRFFREPDNKKRHLQNEQSMVTLFSFRHVFVGEDSREYVHQFSPDGKRGYVRLFDNVHCAFAELALANPHAQFVIKLKWRDFWVEQIVKALEKKGFTLAQIPNLKIVATEERAQDLILQSCAVIALNSFSLLEARLAGKPAILPYFDEIVDTYPHSVAYRDLFSEFQVVHSPDKLKHAVQASLIDTPVYRPASEYLIKQYFGFGDGRALDRVIMTMKSTIRDACGKGIYSNTL